MYQFKKVNEDKYILIMNDKEFIFTRTIDIAKEIQSIDLETTFIVSEWLAERGETYDNTKLRITRTEGNKTIVDESNLRKIEEKAKSLAFSNILEKIFQKCFNMKFLDFIKETGIQEDSIFDFCKEFAEILTNGIPDDTPSEQNTQDNRETE